MLGLVLRLASLAGGRPFGFFSGWFFIAFASLARQLSNFYGHVKGILKGKKMGGFTFFFASPF
jgi:hypothetical protein